MLLETLNVARDFGRVHEIASILIRYGFGDVVRRLGMVSVVERAGQVLHWSEIDELTRMEPPARVRSIMEEMGPTFVKLGQILATRPDLFAPDWIAEFEKLQDHVPPVNFSEVEPQLKEDLGASPDNVFSYFNQEPIAAASIAQVYKAILMDGSPVIVKVRRPGIRETVEADLRLLNQVAEIAEKEIKALRRYKPREVIHQFTVSLRRELDLEAECRNAERMMKNFSKQPDIVIPEIYWQWSSERVNVQEYIDGIPGRDIVAIDKAGLDRKILAAKGADAVLKMILVDGFFHADPHPGNCFFLTENRLAFIDFGMVGRLSEERRNQVITLLQGLVERKTDNVVKILMRWTENYPVNTDNLKLDIDNFIDLYHGIPLKRLNITDLLINLTTMLRDHQLFLPPDLALMIKAFITLEGMGRQLDPDFNLVEVASPMLKQAMLTRFSPDEVAKRGLKNMSGFIDLFTEFPQDMHRLFEAVRRGALSVRLDISKPEWLGKELDRAVNRLSVSLVTAALIVGSSIVSTVDGGASSVFGLTGFIGAVIGGIWLLLSIWRSG